MIRWPGSVHDAHVFREGVVPHCSKIIVERKPLVTICILGDTTYPPLAYIIKEFASGGENGEEQFFGF